MSSMSAVGQRVRASTVTAGSIGMDGGAGGTVRRVTGGGVRPRDVPTPGRRLGVGVGGFAG